MNMETLQIRCLTTSTTVQVHTWRSRPSATANVSRMRRDEGEKKSVLAISPSLVVSMRPNYGEWKLINLQVQPGMYKEGEQAARLLNMKKLNAEKAKPMSS